LHIREEQNQEENEIETQYLSLTSIDHGEKKSFIYSSVGGPTIKELKGIIDNLIFLIVFLRYYKEF